MGSPWYLLFEGSSPDGRSAVLYCGRTENAQDAQAFLAEAAKDRFSTSYIVRITDTTYEHMRTWRAASPGEAPQRRHPMAISLVDAASQAAGTVGILSGDLSRWNWFNQSLMGLMMPPGTQVLWVTGQFVAAAVNTLIAAMSPESAFLCILADDHIFKPDMLLKLLAHDVDIVAPLVCLRRLPFSPSLFRQDADGAYVGYTWAELVGKTGLLAVPSMGGPGVVVRRRVFEAMQPPWFTCQAGEQPQEDLQFFSRCGRLGFVSYVDLNIEIGHCIPAAVFPQRQASGDYHVRVWSHTDLGAMAPTMQQPRPAGAYHAVT